MSDRKRPQIIFARTDIPLTNEEAKEYILSDDEMESLARSEFVAPKMNVPGKWVIIDLGGGMKDASGIMGDNNEKE